MLEDQHRSTPVPDPTVLTTEALHRESAYLQEQTATLFSGLRELMAEKLRAIDQQLSLVERQRVEQKKDTKDAVDAALTAQKEAVKEQTTASERAIAKSEAATTKQLEQLNVTFATAIKGVTDLLNDTKDRVSRIESAKTGAKESISGVYALVSVAVGVVGLIVAAYLATH